MFKLYVYLCIAFVVSSNSTFAQCSGSATISQPIITSISDTIWQSNDAELQVIYNSTASYQWYVNGTEITGATSFILQTGSLVTQHGLFTCSITLSNDCTVVTDGFNLLQTSINDEYDNLLIFVDNTHFLNLISNKEIAFVHIISYTGAVLMIREYNNEPIDIKHLANGIYIARCYNNTQQQVGVSKFTKN